ncbi:MAG: transporter [Bacteroidales bacterium]|nr:transporter [Bacteroidales bacterium]
MAQFLSFLKRWMLPVAMSAGALLYFLYRYAFPFLHPYGPQFTQSVEWIQPILIFTMLFMSFSCIKPSQLRPHRWQFRLLAIQALVFVGAALIALSGTDPGSTGALALECLMICAICPTAAAAPIFTAKMGGDIASLVSYVVLANLLTSVLVPLFVPLLHPSVNVSFWSASGMILAKIFPLLIGPFLTAWLVRCLFPSFHRKVVENAWASFYVWSFSLMLAILMSVRFLFASSASRRAVGVLVAVSSICCLLNFAIGRIVGLHVGRAVRKQGEAGGQADPEAGAEGNIVVSVTQSMGQKNTVFSIWMGYTFFTPVTSITGGFYSIWQNIINSWQLEQKRKKDDKV